MDILLRADSVVCFQSWVLLLSCSMNSFPRYPERENRPGSRNQNDPSLFSNPVWRRCAKRHWKKEVGCVMAFTQGGGRGGLTLAKMCLPFQGAGPSGTRAEPDGGGAAMRRCACA